MVGVTSTWVDLLFILIILYFVLNLHMTHGDAKLSSKGLKLSCLKGRAHDKFWATSEPPLRDSKTPQSIKQDQIRRRVQIVNLDIIQFQAKDKVVTRVRADPLQPLYIQEEKD